MPIYEEKLVSPFAIRFTQEHIRTTFRDGRSVEAAIEEINQGHGTGNYDVILRAPFPPIEILRWCMPRQDADLAAETNCPVGVRPREHWFTLDNRRLFCLQRAAVAAWPRRCAAVVMILYADPGTVRKKYDSASAGFAVSVAHSYDDIPVMRWDWRERILPLEVSAVTENHGVLGTVIADDRKRTVDALLDAARAKQNAAAATNIAQQDAVAGMPMSRTYVGGSASSTATPKGEGQRPPSPSTESEAGSESNRNNKKSDSKSASGGKSGAAAAAAAEEEAATAAAAARALDSDNYDPVVANAIREIKDQINARGADGKVDLPHWNDRYGPILGPMRQFIESRPDKFHVVPRDGDNYIVVKARKKAVLERQSDRGSELALEALEEIEGQLSKPGHDGRLSLQSWREKFEPVLGSLKGFLKLWPDKFTIISGEGRHFRVVRTSDGASMRAIREVEELLKNADLDGYIEVPRWKERFEKELGSFQDFLAAHPDRFTILHGKGGSDFRVLRTKEYLSNKAVEELDRQVDSSEFDGFVEMPMWEETYAPILGTLREFLESRPDRFNVVPGEEPGSYVVQRCSDDLVSRALREVEEQIGDSKHDGKLRVSRWNDRYRDSLGSLRSFLERYPERFHIVDSDGGKFIVTRATDRLAIQALQEIEAIIDKDEYSGYLEIPDWEKRYSQLGDLKHFIEQHPYLLEVFDDPDGLAVDRVPESIEVQAMREIDDLLAEKGNSGHVRLPNWNEVYSAQLGNFRRFCEAQPGRFTVIPEAGNKFSVARVGEDMVQQAHAEIAQHMAQPNYDGLLLINDWTERFLPFLGTIRQFVVSRPDRFKHYNFGNVLYAFATDGPPRPPRRLRDTKGEDAGIIAAFSLTPTPAIHRQIFGSGGGRKGGNRRNNNNNSNNHGHRGEKGEKGDGGGGKGGFGGGEKGAGGGGGKLGAAGLAGLPEGYAEMLMAAGRQNAPLLPPGVMLPAPGNASSPAPRFTSPAAARLFASATAGAGMHPGMPMQPYMGAPPEVISAMLDEIAMASALGGRGKGGKGKRDGGDDYKGRGKGGGGKAQQQEWNGGAGPVGAPHYGKDGGAGPGGKWDGQNRKGGRKGEGGHGKGGEGGKGRNRQQPIGGAYGGHGGDGGWHQGSWS